MPKDKELIKRGSNNGKGKADWSNIQVGRCQQPTKYIRTCLESPEIYIIRKRSDSSMSTQLAGKTPFL